MSPPSWATLPPPTLSHSLGCHRALWQRVLSKSPLALCFTFVSVYVSMLLFPFVQLSPPHPPWTQLGAWGSLASYTFSRSLAKSWPSFSWSKLAMNCWQDIFLPMFCNGGMVLPESRDGAWYGLHILPCPARGDEAASRAVMRKDCLNFPLSLQEFTKLFHIQDSIWSSSITRGWGSPQTQMKESG